MASMIGNICREDVSSHEANLTDNAMNIHDQEDQSDLCNPILKRQTSESSTNSESSLNVPDLKDVERSTEAEIDTNADERSAKENSFEKTNSSQKYSLEIGTASGGDSEKESENKEDSSEKNLCVNNMKSAPIDIKESNRLSHIERNFVDESDNQRKKAEEINNLHQQEPKGPEEQESCRKVEPKTESDQLSDEDLDDVQDLNCVCTPVDKAPGGERKGSLVRRNLSIGSFRRLFKKNHARSFSESPIKTPSFESDGGEDKPRFTQSDTGVKTPRSPLSPDSQGEDEVFGLGEVGHPHKTCRAHSDTDARIHPKSKLRHTHTLPSLFSQARRLSIGKNLGKSQDDSEAKDVVQMWKKIGSFGFSRQLTNCKEQQEEFNKIDGANLDAVYKVLKEGIDLRYKDLSPNPSASSANGVKTSAPSTGTAKRTKRILKHQLSEPTPECNVLFQEVRRAASSEDSISRAGRDNEFSPTLPDTRNNARKISQATSPILKSVDDRGVDENENALSQQKQKEIERLTEEGCIYVALYKYDAREKEDLSLRIGDKVHVTDDSNDKWWMGECDSKTGFIPSNYVMQLRPKEKIYICPHATILQDFSKNEIQLKKNQVVAVSFARPVNDSDYVLTRCSQTEGYVYKENLQPL